MPKRREGPVKNKQTDYYFFDEYVGFPPDRKRVRISLRTKDPLRAQWLWEQEYKKQWSAYYGLEKPRRPTPLLFSDLVEEYVKYQRDIKKAKEWKTTQYRLDIIKRFWNEDPKIAEISKAHLVKLDAFLKAEKKSKYTINHYFALLKAMFNYATREEKSSGKNPINEIRPYTVDEKRREYSPEELKQIFDAVEKIEREARANALIDKNAKNIVLILLYTGMRVGELLNLKWENVRKDRIVMKRSETKQRKEKVIPITPVLQRILEDLKSKEKGDGYVLPLTRRRGSMLSGWTNHLLRKIRKHSGIEDFVFHNLRHTASTIMVSQALGQGVGLADVMKVLGHSQVKTTMRYLHADFDRMKKALEILQERAGT